MYLVLGFKTYDTHILSILHDPTRKEEGTLQAQIKDNFRIWLPYEVILDCVL